MNATQSFVSLVSIGCAAGTLNQTVHAIHLAAVELGIQPVAKLNFVPHFAAEDIEVLRQHFAAQNAARSQVSKELA